MSILDDALSKVAADPRNPYWCRRVCELALGASLDPAIAARCVVVVANHDPMWIASSLAFRRELGLAGALPSVVEEIERQIQVPNESLEHLVKAKIWLASLPFVGEPKLVPFERAAKHLVSVATAHRAWDFAGLLLSSLRRVDYAGLTREAAPALASVPEYDRGPLLLEVLSAAAENDDWPTYMRFRADYEPIRQAGDSDALSDFSILSLDGLQHLQQSDLPGATRVLDELVTRAPLTPYIGTTWESLAFLKAAATKLDTSKITECLRLARNEGKKGAIDALLAVVNPPQ